MRKLEQRGDSGQVPWLRFFFKPSSVPGAAVLSVLAVLFLPGASCFVLALLLMVCAAVIDWQTFRLPDCLTLPILVLAVCSAPFPPELRLIGAICAGGVIWVIGALFQKVRGYPALGFGDVKLAAGCGSIVGVEAIGVLLLLSSLLALCLIAIEVSIKGRDQFGSRIGAHSIAFGPFLVVATLLIVFVQQAGALI